MLCLPSRHGWPISRFDDVRIDPRARPRWLATGFTPAEARAWTDLDVYPHEARVWRAFGKSLDDARAHRAAGGDPLPPLPPGVELAFGGGSHRSTRAYFVVDPPGTRGRVAEPKEDPFTRLP